MKIIAFYLPQYHSIPENDEWWGRGFTDWWNVKNAKPLYRDHFQPHIPINSFYYDLGNIETIIEQSNLAFSYGIDGFCYYHYWFNGKLLLEKPFNSVMESDKVNLPFCLCWANENWTRRWDGKEREILIAQDYQLYDHKAHFNWLLRPFSDKRYITVEGKPLFLIYFPSAIKNIATIVDDWKRMAKKNGLNGLYICAVHSHKNMLRYDKAKEKGFDAVIEFNPNISNLPSRNIDNFMKYLSPRIINKLVDILALPVRPAKVINIFSYDKYVKKVINTTDKKGKYNIDVFPCVFPSWDNSPRHKNNPIIIQNDSGELFKKWLLYEWQRISKYEKEKIILFVNAWNEWAEGCHLEPDIRNGYKYLEAIKEVKWYVHADKL